MELAKFAILHRTLTRTNRFHMNFPAHRGPNINTSTYRSTKWRAEIKIYRADLSQIAKTSPICPKIWLAYFMPRRLGGFRITYMINRLYKPCNVHWNSRQRAKLANFLAREKPPAPKIHEYLKISNFAPDLDPHECFWYRFSSAPWPNHNHQHKSFNKPTDGN